MNMKSALTPNLGFATPIDGIRPLLERPNSMAWSQWLRLGALDETRWVTGQPAMWSSKVGRVRVDGVGEGFGGRAYCHWVQRPEHQPYQVEVMVRLTDESGAAGIIFGSDGGDTHYGFYPSNSQLRLTRFEGPSVYDWTILDQVRSSHYRKGDWNHLRVVHRPDTIDCYPQRCSGDSIQRSGFSQRAGGHHEISSNRSRIHVVQGARGWIFGI